MVAAHQASGMSKAAYARHIGVPAHRISYWYWRLRDVLDEGTTGVGGFVPVRVVSDQPPSSSAVRQRRVEVELLEDGRMSVTGDWPSLRQWLQALESAS